MNAHVQRTLVEIHQASLKLSFIWYTKKIASKSARFYKLAEKKTSVLTVDETVSHFIQGEGRLTHKQFLLFVSIIFLAKSNKCLTTTCALNTCSKKKNTATREMNLHVDECFVQESQLFTIIQMLGSSGECSVLSNVPRECPQMFPQLA